MPAAVRAALAEILGADVAAQISDTDPLMSSGLTSTAAVQLTSALEARLGAQLPATLVFDYPSIADMQDFLQESLGADLPGASAAAAAARDAGPPGEACCCQRPVLAALPWLLSSVLVLQ